MRKHHRLLFSVTVVALIAPLISLRAIAAGQVTDADAIQEIVVTATKRETTVQTTPISITALSGAELQERGTTAIESLAQSVPGVSMRTGGPGETEFEMRGMASTGGNSPTVGFYLDETSLTAPAASNNGKVVIDPNLYDINRIEVLRGPQGTLYGAGSMGGTIKVIPNAPDPKAFAVSGQSMLSATDGGGFNHAENAMVNFPLLAGEAALRVVGSESHVSGWIDRVVIAPGQFPLETDGGLVRGNVLASPVQAIHSNVNDTETSTVRASLLWNPTDRLTITPSFIYQQTREDGLSTIDSDPGTDAHYQPYDVAEPFSDRFHLASIKSYYHLDWADIAATFAHWSRSETLSQDSSESFQWGLGLPSFYPAQGGIGSSLSVENDKSRQTSVELRLSSVDESPLKWLLGYYYQTFESFQNAVLSAPQGAYLFGTDNLYTQAVPTKILQQAVFADVSYQITPGLQFDAGLRHFGYHESVTTAVSGAISPSGSDAVTNFFAAEKNRGFNPKFTLSYEMDKDLLLYATAAKGFRPGGGTGPVPTSGPIGTQCEANLQDNLGTSAFVASPVAFGPDTVWSYEVGEKSRAFDHRLTLNGAVYYEDWRGIQQNIPLPCGYNYQANAGDAHVYGGELELTMMPATGLILAANGSYTHAEIVSVNVLNAGITPGTPVQEVPAWTSTQSITYRHPAFTDVAAVARLENNFIGARTDATYSINRLPAYDLTSLRTGLEGQRWSALIFANNLLNKRALLNDMTLIAINLPSYNRVAISQPLTVGVEVNYRFVP